MSGIAALAAAAAATQKINTTVATVGTPTSGVRVVTPTIMAQTRMKMTPVSARTGAGQTVRMGECHHIASVITLQ